MTPRQRACVSRDVSGLNRLEELASCLAGLLRPGDVVLLHGGLGAGKTTLVRALAESLGIDPRQVTSPTFALVHEYAIPGGGGLIHMDLYRLGPGADIFDLGIDDMLDGSRIVLVEWPEYLSEPLSSHPVEVRFHLSGGDPLVRRAEITFSGPEARARADALDRCLSGHG